MRYLLLLTAFIAAFALPLLTPAPVSAGTVINCPEGYYGIPIAFIQQIDPRPGIARAAAA